MPCSSSSLCAYYKFDHPKRWILATVLVCLFGFLTDLRPSEPFLTQYLTQDKNLTESQVDNEVYPYWTYCYMMALVPAFLFTDILRYKVVIVVEALGFIGTWVLLLWGTGVAQMKGMQAFYGLGDASEIAYLAYVFAAVPRHQYQQVSSYTRSALLMGRFIAGALGQLLISLKVTNYFGLNVISLGSVCCSLVVAVCLPTVKQTLHFNRKDGEINAPSIDLTTDDDIEIEPDSQLITGSCQRAADVGSQTGMQPDTEPKTETPTTTNHTPNPRNLSTYHSTSGVGSRTDEEPDSDPKTEPLISTNHPPIPDPGNRPGFVTSCRDNFSYMLGDIWVCYGNFNLLKWSLWWAFASCGDFQVGNYIQNLWEIIYRKQGDDPPDMDLYNGAVEAVTTLTGALCAFLIMFARIDWRLFGELLLGVVSLVEAALLVVMGVTTNIWLCYVFYILFRSSYQLVITIATFQIAKYLAVERYALVFGINMFMALVLGSMLTFIVVDARVLDTPADTQFIIYGGYFFTLSCIFCTKAVYSISKYGWRAAWRDCRATATPSELAPPIENSLDSSAYQVFYNDSENKRDV